LVVTFLLDRVSKNESCRDGHVYVFTYLKTRDVGWILTKFVIDLIPLGGHSRFIAPMDNSNVSNAQTRDVGVTLPLLKYDSV
jgi:hypothetical protein